MIQRVALVTGANKGIGFEVCRQLKERQIKVILTSRNVALGEAAAQKLSQKVSMAGAPVQYCRLDVVDQKSIDQAFEWVNKEHGRLDILVNNAGILIDRSKDHPEGEGASLLNTSIEVIRESLETNTFGAIRMIQKFAPLMKRNHYGRIVNVSSGMGQLSEMNGGWPSYRISKTALNAVTRIAADELQDTGILVNSVCPGWVRTDMGGAEAELSVEQGADTLVWLATLPEGGPTGGFFRERERIEW